MALTSSAEVIHYEKWEKALEQLRPQYRNAEPFPSIVIDDFLNPDVAREVMEGFPSPTSDHWMHYTHVNERKLAQTKREFIHPAALRVIDELNSPRFIKWLEELSGIKGLVPDEALEGGGLHQTKRGGFLNVHADFTAHPHKKNWARRLNAIIYFNENWKEDYGGQLQLWDKQAKQCVKKVSPIFNRCMIFSTDRDSFHGHPDPLTCPEGMTRKSVALYYFTEEAKPLSRSTEYVARPEDSSGKKLMVYLDKMVLRGVHFAKQRFGLSDRTLSRLLRFFSRS